jgi:DNA-binding transcriptional ArsR family regulator
MAAAFENLVALDKVIHEPARLVIMTILSSCQSADFLFLQRLTGLTKGNLSSHLSRLEEAGLLRIEKQFVGKKPHTQVALTDKGYGAIEQHWQFLESLRRDAEQWGPNPTSAAPGAPPLESG